LIVGLLNIHLNSTDRLPPLADLRIFRKAVLLNKIIGFRASKKGHKQFRPAKTEYRPRFALVKHSFVISQK
jgi:hypothetical protein